MINEDKTIAKADKLIDANKLRAEKRIKRLFAQVRAECKVLSLRPIPKRYEEYAIKKIRGL